MRSPAAAFMSLAGIPLMPDGRREAREDVFDLRGERGRRDRFGENAQPCALGRLLRRGDRAHRADERRPRENLSHVASASACDRDRKDRAAPPARRRRSRRGSPGATGCLRFSSAVLRGSRRAVRSRGRRVSSPSRSTAAGRARCLRAGARTEGSARPAGACSRPCRPARARRPSASETTGARPHREARAGARRTRRRPARRGWRRLFPRACARIRAGV